MRLGPVFISAATLINLVGSDHLGIELLLHGGCLNVKINKLLTVRIHHHLLDVEIGARHKSLHQLLTILSLVRRTCNICITALTHCS